MEYACQEKGCPARLKIQQNPRSNIGLVVSNVKLDHTHPSQVGSVVKDQAEPDATTSIEIPDSIKQSLGQDFLVQSFEALDGGGYTCKFRLPCATYDELAEWKARFEETDKSDFSI